ncbi:hypothetical protein [Clostridium cibarium]|uniref:Uncharacterized protein n=1 Tax=Clostridium cibarium TaxID=2762247 RepID=A0ABR8PXN6_9CLOT|nr:hypothetical protein [Clostridium cibarium]MBD7912936.1 hypothetical protein [Clostridium cibarium]
MENIKDIIKGFIKEDGINEGFIVNRKTQNENITERILNSVKVREVINKLSTADLLEIKDMVILNAWSSTCLTILDKHKGFFKDYINKRFTQIEKIVVKCMYDTFTVIQSDKEEEYLDYKKLDKELVSNEGSVVRSYWTSRNIYIYIRNINPDLSQLILKHAQELYSLYLFDLDVLNNEKGRISNIYSNLRTTKGRLKFIDQRVWLKVGIRKENEQETFDISNLIEQYKDVQDLLKYTFTANDIEVAVAILDVILFIMGIKITEKDHISKRNSLKENVINQVKPFLHNEGINEVYNILINM